MRTSCPSSSSRRMRRSYVRYVAAWPRCVESYGVMPHTYMRTVGPTSNGTTPRCTVSKRWIVTAGSSCRAGTDAFDAQRSLALVAEVDGEERGRERLETDRVLQRP